MTKRSTLAAGLVSLCLLALPAAAQALPWGGAGFNDLGSSYALFQTGNGFVRLTNAQMILSCRDVEDGTYSDRAFTTQFRNRTELRRNRFSFRFSAQSGGRLGDVRMEGILRSNGTGAVRLRIEAVANSDRGGVIERCQGATRIVLRRGGTRR